MNPKKPTTTTPKPNQPKKPSRAQFSTYIKYSGLAFQMIAVMGLAVWGGMRLDDHLENRFPIFVVVFGLLAFGASLYVLIRNLPKNE
uniref:AtpZ/AtpI family protein n=1 Tax=Roseihalotalea indica TaxID=2867963 RepID=A0AA49GNV5_9BACT|nr:AtpZ/AtpI family protein [Tunicatimonas sp. TK19036]